MRYPTRREDILRHVCNDAQLKCREMLDIPPVLTIKYFTLEPILTQRLHFDGVATFGNSATSQPCSPKRRTETVFTHRVDVRINNLTL